MKIFHIADLHLGLRFKNHPEAQEILVQAINRFEGNVVLVLPGNHD